MAALLLAVILQRAIAPPVPPDPLRPPLRRWDLPGCYDLSVDSWTFRSVVVPGSGPPVFPGRILLTPDSTDEQRRPSVTYRADSLDPDSGFARFLRWFVRADTLWLVRSEGRTQTAIALLAANGGFVGRVRSRSTAGSWDGSAAAAAHRVRCGTGAPERTWKGPRR
ncbi:MAG: hypothetical protein ACE5HQ_03960 [Gemmatimonadota bacterium]